MSAEPLQLLDSCPACGRSTASNEILFVATVLRMASNVRKCDCCGLVYKEGVATATKLANVYLSNYVHFDSDSMALGPAEINSARQKLNRCESLITNPRQPGQLRLLDVGCGSGGFVRIARTLGYLAEGIDPYLPSNLFDEGLRRAVPDDLTANSYDIVVALNVVEHITEPVRLFSAIRRLVRPGGVFLVTCPYGDSLARRFYGPRWGHLALDEHILFWTPKSLTRLLRSVGFDGKTNYRIAGSPFPDGRVRISPPERDQRREGSTVNFGPSDPANTRPSIGAGLQAHARRFGRWVQTQENFGNAVRRVVHLLRAGEYLEFAIASE